MENSKVGFAGSVQSAEGSAAREDKEAGRVGEAKGRGAAQKGRRSRHGWRCRMGFVQIDQKKPTLVKVLVFEFLGFSKKC